MCDATRRSDVYPSGCTSVRLASSAHAHAHAHAHAPPIVSVSDEQMAVSSYFNASFVNGAQRNAWEYIAAMK
jgi:protein tyrosine phosphatase